MQNWIMTDQVARQKKRWDRRKAGARELTIGLATLPKTRTRTIYGESKGRMITPLEFLGIYDVV